MHTYSRNTVNEMAPKVVYVGEDTPFLTNVLPVLKLIFVHHGMSVFFRIVYIVLQLEEELETKPRVMYYNKRALVFGWKRVALHIFTNNRISQSLYVQIFETRQLDKYTLTAYERIEEAITACKNALIARTTSK